MIKVSKLLTAAAAALVTAAGCSREADVSAPEAAAVNHRVSQFVCVPITMAGEDGRDGAKTKSVVTAAVEDFRCAYLFAFASDGAVFTLDDETDTPIAIYTEDKSFDWDLPTGQSMQIWAIVNPMQEQRELLDGYLQKSGLTVSDLEAMTFSCGSTGEMLTMETSGMPMSGIMRDIRLESDEDPIVFTLRRLFARYDVRINTSRFAEKGWNVTAARILASRSNTEAPYFYTGSGAGFRQSSADKLKVVDMATDADISSINDLGEDNRSNVAATLYFLENCQGDATATASKWSTVGTELSDEVGLCSYIEFAVNANKEGYGERSFKYRLYPGQNPDMKSNFDIIRNKHKRISITLDAPTDGFQWTNTSALRVSPGESITIPFETSLDASELSIRAYEGGAASSNLTVTGRTFSKDNLSLPEGSRQTCYPNRGTVTFRASDGACDQPKEFAVWGGNEELNERAEVLVAFDINLNWSVLPKPYDYYPEMQTIEWVSTGKLLTEPEIDFIISHARMNPSPACQDSPITLSKIVDPGTPGTAARRFQLKAGMMPWHSGRHSFTLTLDEDSFAAPEVKVLSPTVQLLEPHDNIYDPMEFEVAANGFPTDIDVILSYNSANPPASFPEGMSVRLDDDLDVGPLEIIPAGGGDSFFAGSTSGTRISARAQLRTRSFEGLDFSAAARSEDLESGILVQYPHGGVVGVQQYITIPNPFWGIEFPSAPYEYEVHKGRTAQKEYVSVRNVDTSDSNVYTVENMLTWPDRRFTVDLTRGGTVDMSHFTNVDAWKGNGKPLVQYHNGGLGPQPYSFDGSTLSFRELNSTDYNNTENVNMFEIGGPNYIGKRITHQVSGESLTRIHSIVREYCHYNVFATFDAREDKNIVRDNVIADIFNGSTVESVDKVETWLYNQSGVTITKRIAAINATLGLIAATAGTFGFAAPMTILGAINTWSSLSDSAVTVIDTELKSNFPASFKTLLSSYITPVAPAHVNALGTRGAREDSASGNSFVENYFVPEPGDPADGKFYTVGYSRGTSNTGYHLVGLEGSEVTGLGGGILNAPNWRTLIARNAPSYKVNTGVIPGTSGRGVTRTGVGEYNFDRFTGDPVDPSGLSYFYFHPFWEGKEGRFAIKAKELSPKTDYGPELAPVVGDFSVTLANGWYDPTLYTDGIPLLFNKVGKYFFPDSPSDTKRAGMFPYYPGETPWTDSQSSDREKDLYNKSSLNTRDTDHSLSPRNYAEWQACPIRPGEEY